MPQAAKITAIFIAGAAGAAAGAVAVSMLPPGRFALSGFALLPLFVLLEVFIKHALPAFDGDPNAARGWLAGTILVCFYAAWFVLHAK